MRPFVWFHQSIAALVKAGHRLEDVGEYTLDQFVIFLDGIAQLDAATRQNFVADMGIVVGSVLGGNKHLKEHMASLSSHALGESNGNGSK